MNSLAPGLIPIFEEHSARIERGISLKEWDNIGIDEKAMIIAQRRISNAMKNLQAEAEIAEAERKAKK